MEGGKPVVITNTEGVRTTPSVVAFTKTGERLVGEPAKRQAVTNADHTISSPEQLCFRQGSHPQHASQRCAGLDQMACQLLQ